MPNSRSAGLAALSSLVASSRPWLWLMAVLLVPASFGWLQSSGAVVQQASLDKIVSSASFEENALAPGALATLFGTGLAAQESLAAEPQTQLADRRVEVNGRAARLFYVSPTQINFLVPQEASAGNAAVSVRTADGALIAARETRISAVAPAIFNLDNIALGSVSRYKSDGAVTGDSIGQAEAGGYRTKPIDLAVAGDRVFLIFFLTGLRNANPETVQVLLENESLKPAYAGPVPGLLGLDQINLELPPRLADKGVLNLTVAAPAGPASNAVKIEFGSGFSSLSGLRLSKETLLAGETIEIMRGTNPGDSALPTSDVEVLFAGATGIKPDDAQADKLTLRVPFGSQSGPLQIKFRGRIIWTSSTSIRLRTSISGIVENADKTGIPGMIVRLADNSISATTNKDGAFVLADVPPATRQTIVIDSVTSQLPYPPSPIGQRVDPNRDNQFGIVRMTQNSNGNSLTAEAAEPGQSNPITLELAQCPNGNTNCPFTLTAFARGRTPVDLPVGTFSSAIAQITPFGQPISPGGRLRFQNPDNIPAGTPVRVYKFDQARGSETLGQFVDIGAANFNGQFLETAAGAVNEGGYYFISRQWPTATVYGRVVEPDGVRPVRRAIISARGQSVFTDGNGSFVLRNIPVITAGGTNDPVTLDVTFHRADGSVARGQSSAIPISAGDVKLSIPSALKLPPLSLAPVIVAPEALTIYENELRNFNFLAVDPANDTALTVNVAPASLGAQVLSQGSGLYTLRLNPGANTAGSYPLTLSAANNQQQTTNHVLTVTVLRAPAGVPIALDQTVTTAEAQQVSILLTGSNAGSAPVYEIVTPPARGTLTGTGGNQRYTPAGTFNGTDSFTFKVRNGNLESNIARVTIAVRPRNHAPTIIVPAAQMVSAGQEVRFLVTANDIDPGQTLTATMSDNPADATFAETSPGSRQWEFSWRPRYVNAGGIAIRFTITDNGVGRLSASGTVTISVDPKWAKTSGPEGDSIYNLYATPRVFFADRFRSVDNAVSWSEMDFTPRSVVALNSTLFAVAFITGQGTGVYRSTDDGRSWTKVYSLTNGSFTSQLAIGNGAVYAGANNGVFRSTDNGNSWQAAGLTGQNIALLAANGNVLIACRPGQPSACQRSLNAGQNWSPIAGVNNLAALNANGSRFFALSYGTGLLRLTDDGQQWEPINPIDDSQFFAQPCGLAVSGSTIYIGYEFPGGIYRSTNSGVSWSEVSGSGRPGSVFSVAAAGEFVLAGNRLGVYRTTGDAAPWQLANTGLTNARVGALVAQGDTVIAASRARGLFRSTNDGQSWQYNPALPGGDGGFAAALTTYDNAIYAGFYGQALARSTDRGRTWRAYTNGFPFADLTVGALTTSGGALYAATVDGVYRLRSSTGNWEFIGQGLPRLPGLKGNPVGRADLMTRPHSRRWSRQIGGEDAQPIGSVPFPGDGVYFIGALPNALAVAPNPAPAGGNTMFVSYYELDEETFEVKSHVFRSRNDGASWQELNTGLPTPVQGPISYYAIEAINIRGNFAYAGTPRGVYRMALDGTQWTPFSSGIGERPVFSFTVVANRLYAGTSNGVYRLSTDSQTWESVNAALRATNIISLAASENDAVLFAGTEGNAVFRLTSNTQTWNDITANLSTGLGENLVNAVVTRGTTIYAGTRVGGVFASTNGGQNWSAVNQGLPASANVRALVVRGTSLFAAELDGGVYELPLNANAWTPRRGTLPTTKFNALFANGAQLLVGTDAGVFLSNNSGVSWQPTGSLGGRRVLSLSVSRDGGTLLAGTSGGVFYSLNNGGTWTAATGLPATVNALIVGGSNARIFAGTDDRGIYRSDDGGFSWAQVNNRIPANLNVRALATNGALVFAGSIYGVFRTGDDGATWEQINAGLTDTFVTALTLNGDDLIAGAIKGGVFLSKLSSDPLCRPSVTGQPVGRVVTAGQTAQLQVTVTSAPTPAYQWYRGLSGDTSNPIPGATRADYTTGAINAAESYWVLVSNACGTAASETATVTVNTPPRVDLALTQTVTPASARPGDEVSFTLTVANNGQDAAFAVTVTDALPSQVTLTSCEATGGGVCGGAGNNRTVTFASLAAGASATITLRAKVNAGVSGVIRNTATAGAGAGESDLLNNLATAGLTVAPADPNAPFISALNPATATAGGAGFTLTVTGSNFASGAQVRWNGGARQTAFSSAAQLMAQISAGDLSSAGVANVTVVNSDGATSNVLPFTIKQAGCSYTVTPPFFSFAGSGGTGTATVTAGAGCEWTAQASLGLGEISITNGKTGSGSGTVTFTVSPITRRDSQIGALLIAGQYVTITQSGSESNCPPIPLNLGQTINGALSVNDCRDIFYSAAYADLYTFNGQAGQRIALAQSSTDFNTLLGLWTPSGSGLSNDDDVGTNSRVPRGSDFLVLPETGIYVIDATSARDNVTGNYTLTLTGVPAGANCTYAVTPSVITVGAAGGTAAINVVTQAGCGWTTDARPGVTISSGSTGSGNGTVNISVSANSSGSRQFRRLLVAGQSVPVIQSDSAKDCSFASLNIPQTVNGSFGTGDCRALGRSSYYADFYTFNGRAGQRIAITMSSTIHNTYLSLYGTNAIAVTTDDNGGGGTNSRIPATSGYFVLPYTGLYVLEAREEGLSNAGDYTLSLTAAPEAEACSFALTPAGRAFTSSGGVGNVNVTAASGCAWTAESSAPWIAISGTSAGSGNGMLNFNVAPNTGIARSGSLFIAGQAFAITQSDGCTFTISPTTQSVVAGGATGVVNVMAGLGCAWTATSNAAWLTITAGASGSGAGAVTFTAAANPTAASRTGTLTIAGQTFTATQAAGSFPPTISSLTPNTAQAGGAGFTLTVVGTNFVANSKVRWNGGERLTTFVSATQLTAQISAGDIAAVGTATVTVANSDGQVSTGANFTITAQTRQNSVLRVVAASGSVGGTVAVPIELVSQGDENALGFSLTFDPTILSNPQVTLGSGASGAALNPNLSQAAAGRLGVVLAMPSGQRFAAGVRQIAVVTFTIAANTGAATANLEFGNQPIPREASDVNANELGATYTGGVVTITRGFEADVAPRPNGNGVLSVTDWVLVGRFASGDLAADAGSEFQRTDCAPRSTFGNGAITVSDWVQAGRYAAGLDPLTPAAGPTAPGAFAPAELSALLKPIGWPRLLRVGSPTFGAGQTSVVNVELPAQGEENAVSFSLQFDARQWRFVSATLGEDAQKAALSVNAKFAADGHVGFALALPPGQKFDAGMRSLVTVNFVAAENGGGFAPEVRFSDWPAARELADVKADVLAADWMPAAARELANVSSASLAAGWLARGSLATAFGNGLAVAVQQAEAGALPKTPAGTSVTILDSTGAELVAPLFFVSPGQVNYLLPAETATGRAMVRIVNGDGLATSGVIEVVDVAPGLFAADASGKGVVAAPALRVKADGSVRYEAVSRFDAASGRVIPVPIELGNPGEQVFLILFGTGFGGRGSLAATTLQIGGLPVQASYVGPQGEFAGLDQINLALPRALAGRGEVTIHLTVDGKTANPVTIAIR